MLIMPPTRIRLLIMTLCFTVCTCTELEDKLLEDLLTGHNSVVRPVEKFSDVLTVEMGLSLGHIIKLDVRNQVIALKAWMEFSWNDSHLTWNSSAYEGFNETNILPSKIWRPDITLYTDMEKADTSISSIYPATLQNNGKVKWRYPIILETSCLINVRYFPFDFQSCPLKFGSWSFDGTKIGITNTSSKGIILNTFTNGEWKLLGFPVVKHEEYYPCCVNPYPDLTFTLHMVRKPLYYIYNLILPCIFVLATAVLVFLLPPESGEKVSLGVTVLLALTVFLLLVADILPPQSDTIPLIAQYFGATVIMLAISSILTVINLRIHHQGNFGYRVPTWVRKLILDWLARAMCLRGIVDSNLSPASNSAQKILIDGNKILPIDELDNSKCELDAKKSQDSTSTDGILLEMLKVMKDSRDNQEAKKEEEAIVTDWMLVSMVIDRFLLLTFTLLTIVCSCALLLNYPSSAPTLESNTLYTDH